MIWKLAWGVSLNKHGLMGKEDTSKHMHLFCQLSFWGKIPLTHFDLKHDLKSSCICSATEHVEHRQNILVLEPEDI